ncbi:hypothetical protein EPN95_04460 [Patescibacteria group bacterium]|nr:MAG: hypothetical protein EPN95_04460 [Patescibacteria group bacterium]
MTTRVFGSSWIERPKKRVRKTPRLCATERQEALAFNAWRLAHLRRYPELENLILNPLGGGRAVKFNRNGEVYSPAAKRLQEEGLEKGISDYFLAVPRGSYSGFWIELKAMDGRPSPEQLAFLGRQREYGYAAEWVKGWEGMAEMIVEYLKMPRGRATER